MLDPAEYEHEAPTRAAPKTEDIAGLRRQIQKLEADTADGRRRLAELETEIVELRHTLGLYRDRGGIVERQQQPLAEIVQILVEQQRSPSTRKSM